MSAPPLPEADTIRTLIEAATACGYANWPNHVSALESAVNDVAAGWDALVERVEVAERERDEALLHIGTKERNERPNNDDTARTGRVASAGDEDGGDPDVGAGSGRTLEENPSDEQIEAYEQGYEDGRAVIRSQLREARDDRDAAEAERDRLREAAENWLREYRRFDQTMREYHAEKLLREALRVTEQETPQP